MVLEKCRSSRRHRPSGCILRKGRLACTVWFLPSPLACRMTASICFRSCRVSLRRPLPLFPAPEAIRPTVRSRLRLLFQSGIGVVGLIDTLFRTGEFALDQIAQQRLRGLPVLLIQGEQEKGQHHKDHAQRRRRRTHAALAQKEKRHSNKRRRSETHKLPLRQAEQHLALDFCQVLRDRYVCQWFTSFPQAGYRLQLHFPTHPSRAVRLLRTAQCGAHPP